MRPEDVIAMPILPATLKAAKALGTFEPNSKSYMGGERQLDGALGEVIVKQYLEECGRMVTFSPPDVYDYDLLIIGASNNVRLDVKTKRRDTWNVNQMVATFEGSVQCGSREELACKAVDCYVFVNLAYDKDADEYECAYIMGGMSKDRFLDRCVQKNIGDFDPSNGMVAPAPNFNIWYRELNQIG